MSDEQQDAEQEASMQGMLTFAVSYTLILTALVVTLC
jgi:hypothetical protein